MVKGRSISYLMNPTVLFLSTSHDHLIDILKRNLLLFITARPVDFCYYVLLLHAMSLLNIIDVLLRLQEPTSETLYVWKSHSRLYRLLKSYRWHEGASILTGLSHNLFGVIVTEVCIEYLAKIHLKHFHFRLYEIFVELAFFNRVTDAPNRLWIIVGQTQLGLCVAMTA